MSEFEFSLRSTVKRIIAKLLPKLNRYIADDETLTDLKLGEVDYVQVAMIIENHYGIEIYDEDLEQFKTFGDIINYLKQKISI